MAHIMAIVALGVGLGSLICFIIVLVKLFNTDGVGWGLLGLICGLYTFIWGWRNKDVQGIQNIMLIWTLLTVVSIILQVMIPAMR